ncbi:MAG TPA: 50S ribosomal protein L9 [Sphaerochaeta sp.]|nr:50S ribosomal protein L9 [Sphaerochaeta sp.]
MKIILNQDVANLGEEGDIVVVKAGYARNYLLPKGLAVLHTKANLAIFASRAEAIEKRKELKRKESASLRDRLGELELKIVLPAGESGRLFGSVTNQMVQNELAKLGYEIERKKIEVPTHTIKMTGTYTVHVRLYEGDVADIKLVVASESVEKAKAAQQAKEAAEAAKAAEKAAAEAAAAEAAAAAAEEAEEAAEEAVPEEDNE